MDEDSREMPIKIGAEGVSTEKPVNETLRQKDRNRT